MNHFSRFKVLYITLIIAVAGSIVSALGPLKEMTKDQLHAFSWIYWAVLFFNIVIAGGNNIVAALSVPGSGAPPPPIPKAIPGAPSPVVVPEPISPRGEPAVVVLDPPNT
jgi:hypothetical protein